MKTLQARYKEAKNRLERNGYKVSAGSWIDEEREQFYVCSTKSDMGCLNHPEAEIGLNYSIGYLKP
jgi:hypothetical protein